MIEALGRFVVALDSLPAGWRLWVMGLVFMNLIVPMFFMGRREARIVIAVFLIQGAFMFWLFWMQGFTRLLGIAHLGWLGLIFYLWKAAAGNSGARTPWGIWLRSLLAADAVSLSIDIVDIIRFLLGERAPLM